MPRSTLDLIEELWARAEALWTCALVIGYEDHSEFVWASQGARETLETLNGHLSAGGEPLGFIGATRSEGGAMSLVIEALEEYKDEEWAEKLLFTLAGQLRASLERPA
jgi:hypothetical protein